MYSLTMCDVQRSEEGFRTNVMKKMNFYLDMWENSSSFATRKG